MKIFVINLLRSTTRKEYMNAQFKELGLSGEFLPATDGKNMEQEWSERPASKIYNLLCGNLGFWNNNEIASFASHYRLWQRCVELNEPIIILEDDAVLAPDFKDRLPLVTQLVNKFGYLRLAAAIEPQRGVQAITDYLECYLHYPCGIQGYALNPMGARRLIKHAKRWCEPADIYMDKYWIHGLRPYTLIPPLVCQHPEFDSDMASGQAANPKQYLPKPTGWIKLCREVLVRPIQRLRHSLFDLRHPIISAKQLSLT